MSELITIPAATADIVARFDRPYIGLLTNDRARVFELLVTALLPFGFRLADTEIVAPGKAAEERLVVKIPDRGITFQFGAEEYRFTKDGALWPTALDDTAVWSAAEHALLNESGTKVAGFTATLALHVVPVSKTRDEVIEPFVSPPFKLFTNQQTKAFGAHIRFSGGHEVLVDYSVPYANGIFVRVSLELEGNPSIPEILSRMKNEEQNIFRMLDVQESGVDA